MLNVADAFEKITAIEHTNASQEVSLNGLGFYALNQNVLASQDYPPFDRVAMDGVALCLLKDSLKQYHIQACQKAGDEPLTLKSNDHCIEVMTGAMLPKGCNCVVAYEDILIEDDVVSIKPNTRLQYMHNVHLKGSDFSKGQKLYNKYSPINAITWSILAFEGITKIQVTQKPNIAVFATGDEIVSPHEKNIKPFQIRQSNTYFIQSVLEQNHYDVDMVDVLKDNDTLTFEKLKNALNCHDVLIFSGAVSKGKYDFLPAVLKDLGVRELVCKVAQKPGKPLWVGLGPKNQKVFALPGNPLATFVCMRRYVLPALNQFYFGHKDREMFVFVQEPVKQNERLTLFLPVKVHVDASAVFQAKLMPFGGSGDFVSIRESDGFIQVNPHHHSQIYPYYSWN